MFVNKETTYLLTYLLTSQSWTAFTARKSCGKAVADVDIGRLRYRIALWHSGSVWPVRYCTSRRSFRRQTAACNWKSRAEAAVPSASGRWVAERNWRSPTSAWRTCARAASTPCSARSSQTRPVIPIVSLFFAVRNWHCCVNYIPSLGHTISMNRPPTIIIKYRSINRPNSSLERRRLPHSWRRRQRTERHVANLQIAHERARSLEGTASNYYHHYYYFRFYRAPACCACKAR